MKKSSVFRSNVYVLERVDLPDTRTLTPAVSEGADHRDEAASNYPLREARVLNHLILRQGAYPIHAEELAGLYQLMILSPVMRLKCRVFCVASVLRDAQEPTPRSTDRAWTCRSARSDGVVLQPCGVLHGGLQGKLGGVEYSQKLKRFLEPIFRNEGSAFEELAGNWRANDKDLAGVAGECLSDRMVRAVTTAPQGDEKL